MSTQHIPVLKDELFENLKLKKGDYVIDATLGGGGYTSELSEIVGAKGLVIAIDQDKNAIKQFEDSYKNKYKNIRLINDNFSNLQSIIDRIFEEKKVPGFNGIIFDLGLSSDQLADRTRGFAFQSDGPLKMNFDPEAHEEETAEFILDKYPLEKLMDIFKRFGEEPHSKKIAKAIIGYRENEKITTTKQLVGIIEKNINIHERKRVHPATRIFQALRINVNNELENLAKALPQAVDLLDSGGRIAVISFHSLEDRIAKNYFKIESKKCFCPPDFPVCRCQHQARLKLVTTKPIMADEAEIKRNIRARSAKMRIAEKL
jgi:16S rRNA (cytosine1402-N4)-methyltransferase